jgi:hypothetical protein
MGIAGVVEGIDSPGLGCIEDGVCIPWHDIVRAHILGHMVVGSSPGSVFNIYEYLVFEQRRQLDIPSLVVSNRHRFHFRLGSISSSSSIIDAL